MFELYGSRKTITEVERNLLEAKQGKDESVDAYAARIRRLSITYWRESNQDFEFDRTNPPVYKFKLLV